jgi:hypothetical protein
VCGALFEHISVRPRGTAFALRAAHCSSTRIGWSRLAMDDEGVAWALYHEQRARLIATSLLTAQTAHGGRFVTPPPS